MRILSQAGDLAGKKVLVRNDFNITFGKDGKILDDFKIRASLPTIKYLLENSARIILMSHLGRPDGKIIESMRLGPVGIRLSELLGVEVKKMNECVGPEVRQAAADLKKGEIMLLENVRFNPGEKTDDDGFAKELASCAELYVNDAFGDSHRKHASISAIAKFLPSYAGFLLEKEISILSKVLNNPEKPLAVVIGGAKISTKIKLIKDYLSKADHIILGGALANTVLHAKGLAVGRSLIEEDVVEKVQKLEITNSRLHIPVDVILSEDKEGKAPSRVGAVGKIGEQELILDIGPETVKIFEAVIKKSKTVIWNGPMGYFETEEFGQGTKKMAEIIASADCYSVVGGGETTCFLEKQGIIEKFSHVSTGGGAMMEFLAGDKLPGVAVLE